MIKRIITCAVAIPIVLGLLSALLSFFHGNWVHVSAIYPEHRNLDSVYAQATGFPFPQRGRNDPEMTGVGEIKSVILWNGILGNWIAYGAGILFLEIPVAFIVGIVCVIRKQYTIKESANQ